MSEDTETRRKELQEMARAILCEIYGADSARNSFMGSELSTKANRAGINFTDIGTVSNDNRQLLFEQIYDPKIQADRADHTEELFPRLSRRDFLEQRISRRKARESIVGLAAESSSGTVKRVTTHSANPAQADLPEKLSDIFCRDARRYDGAFEKY